MKTIQYHPYEGQTGQCDFLLRSGERCGQRKGDSIHRELSNEQEAHLAAIKADFVALVDAKYRAGAAEHGGNVWEQDLLTEIEHEAVDLFVYARSLRMKLAKASSRLRKLAEEAQAACITSSAEESVPGLSSKTEL